ncbi:MAG: FHA domain-containing protein [Euryarchaeota archaeon]|nr:FHA domain-containing protein [Euryarchaeota archaeon]
MDEETAPVAEELELARVLDALSHPVRLSLLRILQEPKPIGGIVVRVPVKGDVERTRPISRQGVRDHLDRLLYARLVQTIGDGDRGTRYIVNPQSLYALAESFRQMSRLRPEAELENETHSGVAPGTPFELASSSLIQVKGPQEGRVYPLTPPETGRREWVIGRRRGLDVVLDHDLRVSSENSLVVWEGGVYSIQDLYESRNGTWVNFTQLPPLERRPLRTGDLVQVGQTVLLFRA